MILAQAIEHDHNEIHGDLLVAIRGTSAFTYRAIEISSKIGPL
jgi:hypothetical protein